MESFEESIAAILKQEHEESEMANAEMQVRKAQNMLDHADEIYSRAPRQWIVGEKQKSETKGWLVGWGGGGGGRKGKKKKKEGRERERKSE